jgi:hypothetical protein
MQGVSGVVSVGEDKWLLALTLGPPVHKQWCVPVDFVEDVRDMDEARRTVLFPARSTSTTRPGHVVLVVIEASGRVVAGWEVDVGTERGGVAVAVHVRKADAGSLVVWVLDTDAVHAV